MIEKLLSWRSKGDSENTKADSDDEKSDLENRRKDKMYSRAVTLSAIPPESNEPQEITHYLLPRRPRDVCIRDAKLTTEMEGWEVVEVVDVELTHH